MNYSRREVGLMIPALSLGATEATAAAAQEVSVLPSKVFKYEELVAKKNGENEARAVLNGQNHAGFPVEMHMTKLGPGQAPHPPHHHVHEEMVMLRSGSLDVTISGKTTRATAGSVIYVASNEEHGWKNPGSEPAEYFVIALGPRS